MLRKFNPKISSGQQRHPDAPWKLNSATTASLPSASWAPPNRIADIAFATRKRFLWHLCQTLGRASASFWVCFGGEQSARCEVGLPVLEPTACRKYLILAEMSKLAHAAGFGVAEADSQILEQIRLVGCLVRIWWIWKGRSVEGRQTQKFQAHVYKMVSLRSLQSVWESFLESLARLI